MSFELDESRNSVTKWYVGQQLLNAAPPDTFQANLGSDLLRWVSGTLKNQELSLLEDVSSLLRDVSFPEEVTTNLRGKDGKEYGVPLNIHRTNMIYYRTDCWPEDWTFDLETFCSDERTDPSPESHSGRLCLDHQPRLALNLANDQDWAVNQFVLENLLPAVGGAQLYLDVFQPKETDAFNDVRERLRAVLACARELKNRVTIVEENSWAGTIKAVEAGEADFTVAGDWANGEQTAADLGVVPFPGADGKKIFVFTSDVFPLPSGAEHSAETRELLRTMLSKEAQRAFSELKGSIPARSDIELGESAEKRGQMRWTFKDADARLLATSGVLPRRYPRDLAAALRKVIEGGSDEEVEAALQMFEDGFPIVQEWQALLKLWRGPEQENKQ